MAKVDMAGAVRNGQGGDSAQGSNPPGPSWGRTPGYHWRSWFGYRWRRGWVGQPAFHNDLPEYQYQYQYQTSRQRARQVLEENYGERYTDCAGAEQQPTTTNRGRDR